MKKRICIVISNYNNEITSKLYLSTKKELKKYKFKKVDVVKVPGAFELPVVISKLIKKYDAFIAIGCIIKGETLNFDLISRAITDGIMNISITNKKPIGNSILTLFNKRQAYKRFNKGKEAAQAVYKVLKVNYWMPGDNLKNNPRVIVVQKLYGYFLNKDTEIFYSKHRYKKFIKDIVSGTVEREELLLENLNNILKDEFNPSRTDLILKIMILSATYELMFVHKTPSKVIVSEYVKISDFFLESAHKGYLNAILDKISKNIRKVND